MDIVLFMVATLACSPLVYSQAKDDCKADIIFVIDTSGTVASAFRREVLLAEKISQKLILGGSDPVHRVAVVEFSGSVIPPEVIVDWGQHQDNAKEFIAKMETLKHIGGQTLPATALRYTRDQLITGRRRPDAHLIIIMIYDGITTQDTIPISRELKALPEVKFICLGIGELVRRNELERLATSPQLVFTGVDPNAVVQEALPVILPFLECDTILTTARPVTTTTTIRSDTRRPPRTTTTPRRTTPRRITTTTRPTRRPIRTTPGETTTTAPITLPPGPGNCRLDFLIVLDTSTSVYGVVHAHEVERAVKIVDRLVIGGAQGSRVGLIIFAGSGTAYTVFPLDKYDRKEDINQAMRDSEEIAGTTDIAEALALAADQLSPEYGARLGSAVQVVVFLSDGITPPSQFGRVADRAEELKRKAKYVYAVATDRFYGPQNLKAIASDGSKWFRFSKDGEEDRFNRDLDVLTANC